MIRRHFDAVTYQELKEKMEKSKVLQSLYAFSRNKLLKDKTVVSQECLNMVEKMLLMLLFTMGQDNTRLETRDYILVPRETSVKGH